MRRAAPAVTRLSELLPNQGLDEAFREVEAAVDGRDAVRLAAARATLQTTVLRGAYHALLASLRRGDAADAGSWLLVREYRPPTRFSRPGADATLAVAKLADGQATKAEALAAVRADYLDTYQARLRTALDGVGAAAERGFPSRLAAESALARGYFAVLRDSYARQRGDAAAGRAAAEFDALLRAALARDEGGVERAAAQVDEALAAFRAAPLAPAEEIRRAGQFLRFLALVPVEYGRGVADGRVTLAFEIQEAVTFRDGAAQALADLDSRLVERDPAAAARIDELVTALGADMAAASQGVRVADEDTVRERAQEALDLAESTFPSRVEGGTGRRRLRRHPGLARPRRRGSPRRRVREGGAGAARGLRVLRVRPRAAPARPRAGSVRAHGRAVLVRRRQPSGARAADPAEVGRRGGRRDARRRSTRHSPRRRRRSARARPPPRQSSSTPRSSSSGRGSRPCSSSPR